MSDGKVLIEVDLNDDGVNNALKRVENDAINSGSKIGRSVSKLSEQSLDVAKKAALGILAIGGAFAGFSIKSAGELQATNAQFTEVFGKMEKDASKSVDKIAKETGILPSRLKGTFTQMAAFAKVGGLETAEALDLSGRATLAAADSAAFYDKSIESTTESLQSFLKGNYANDAALGISSTETTRNAAANKLYGKSFNDLEESQKQLTLLKTVEDGNKLSGALGQAARETDGLENVMGNLKQGVIDVAAAFGTPLLGPFIVAAKAAAKVLGDFGKALTANPALVYAIVGALTTLAVAFGTVYLAANKMKILASVKSGLAVLTNPLFLVVLAIGALITAFVYFYKTSEGFRNAVNKIIAPLKSLVPVFKNIGSVMKIIGSIMKAFFTDMQQVGKLNGMLHEILPKSVADSIFNGVMKITHTIYYLINAFKVVAGVASGSISNMEDLGKLLPKIFDKGGRFSETFSKQLFDVGSAIKSVISFFKDLFNPTKKAGESIDFVKIGFMILKTVALGLLGPIGLVIRVIGLVAKALGGGDVKAGIQAMLDGFTSLADGIRDNGGKVGASVGDMLAGILIAIGAALPGIISGALSIIAGFITGLAQGLPQVAFAAFRLINAFTGSMLLLIPTIAASATLMIVALLGSLAAGLPQIILAGVNLLISFIAGLTIGIPRFVLAVTNIIVVFLNSISNNLPRIIAAGINLLVSFLQGITDNLPKLSATVTTLITTFLNTLSDNLPRIIASGSNLLVKFLNGIADNLPKVITAAVNVIVSFLNGIANNLPRIITSAVNLIVAFLRGIASQIGRIVNAAMDLVDAMVRGILQAQGRLSKAVIDLMNGMAKNINNSAPQMKKAAGNLLRAIIEAFPGGGLVTAGFDLMAGLAKGIGNAVGGVISKAKEVAGNIVGAVKGAFKIHSPSRVMEDEVGRYIPEGIAVGMEGNTSKAIKSARLMASKVVSSIPTAEMAMGINAKMSTSMNRASSGNVTNNNYSNDDNNNEIVNLLREIAAKPFVANMDGKRISKAIGREVDRTQGERIKRSDWGLEIDG